jgi:hypothetical protein
MVLTVSFVLPGDRAFLSPSSAELPPPDLTPASRRQDHTTSPSASALFVKSASASTASRPTLVTIAKRPSEGRDGIGCKSDLALRGIKMFLQTGLDDSKITALEQPSDLPVGQLEILPTRAFRDAVTIVLAPASCRVQNFERPRMSGCLTRFG